MSYRKLIQSGNLIELYEYKYDYIPRITRPKQGASDRRVVKSRNRRADNLLRIKKNFARIVRSNLYRSDSPLFVTLTMYETVSLGRAYGSFSRFIQRLRNRFGSCFRYVAVPEFQGDTDFLGRIKDDRGAVHFHVLFWSLPITPKAERQKRYIQWAWRRGFADCVQTDGSFKLIGYMSKYLLKGLQDERLGYQKAYVCSRNAVRPVSSSFASTFQYLDEIVGDLKPDRVTGFETQWLGWCKYTRYSLS